MSKFFTRQNWLRFIFAIFAISVSLVPFLGRGNGGPPTYREEAADFAGGGYNTSYEAECGEPPTKSPGGYRPCRIYFLVNRGWQLGALSYSPEPLVYQLWGVTKDGAPLAFRYNPETGKIHADNSPPEDCWTHGHGDDKCSVIRDNEAMEDFPGQWANINNKMPVGFRFKT